LGDIPGLPPSINYSDYTAWPTPPGSWQTPDGVRHLNFYEAEKHLKKRLGFTGDTFRELVKYNVERTGWNPQRKYHIGEIPLSFFPNNNKTFNLNNYL
jgi:hypothetical protein